MDTEALGNGETNCGSEIARLSAIAQTDHQVTHQQALRAARNRLEQGTAPSGATLRASVRRSDLLGASSQTRSLTRVTWTYLVGTHAVTVERVTGAGGPGGSRWVCAEGMGNGGMVESAVDRGKGTAAARDGGAVLKGLGVDEEDGHGGHWVFRVMRWQKKRRVGD